MFWSLRAALMVRNSLNGPFQYSSKTDFSFLFLSLYRIPCFLKVHFMPSCFYKRPTLVPDFTNCGKSKEDFCFYKKCGKAKTVFLHYAILA